MADRAATIRFLKITLIVSVPLETNSNKLNEINNPTPKIMLLFLLLNLILPTKIRPNSCSSRTKRRGYTRTY